MWPYHLVEAAQLSEFKASPRSPGTFHTSNNTGSNSEQVLVEEGSSATDVPDSSNPQPLCSWLWVWPPLPDTCSYLAVLHVSSSRTQSSHVPGRKGSCFSESLVKQKEKEKKTVSCGAFCDENRQALESLCLCWLVVENANKFSLDSYRSDCMWTTQNKDARGEMRFYLLLASM